MSEAFPQLPVFVHELYRSQNTKTDGTLMDRKRRVLAPAPVHAPSPHKDEQQETISWVKSDNIQQAVGRLVTAAMKLLAELASSDPKHGPRLMLKSCSKLRRGLVGQGVRGKEEEGARGLEGYICDDPLILQMTSQIDALQELHM